MRYIIFIIGLIIIGLRAIGVGIDIVSIGLFIVVSLISSLRDLNHLSEFRGFGINMKFNKQLKELAEETEIIENGLENRVEKEKGLHGIGSSKEQEEDHFDEISTFTDISAFEPDFKHPKIALIQVSKNIEKTLKSISAEILKHDNKYPIAPKSIILELESQNTISKDLLSIFNNFWYLKSRVIHSVNTEFSGSQVLSLVDSGMRILNILKSVENNIKKGLKIKVLN